ncbi:hypothetical protein A5692_24005 [Mycobacterium sp. E342]|uniref:hypothetical protein n=1 Tax=Mycobacterium sp. E342 TaxID=1834147 RepID=UPI0007FC27B0|nr:hypothetical protein [Mycobacterium sp. E342]OBH27769.1 hypothetical protein A5692_24005 [Mycobacterium sp. E342]
MGRHRLAKKRRKSPLVLAAVLAPAAAFFAVAADASPFVPRHEPVPVIGDGAPCCPEIFAAKPVAIVLASDVSRGEGAAEPVAASRYHTRSRFLPAGLAPEQGLQVRTIQVSRSISAKFPQIHEIGGVRPDPLPWHPLGLALDVMIPNPQSADGIALGDEIVAYVMRNARRFGIQDAIWRGVYYTPGGAQPSRLGHYDHVHVTTTGGGYPKGGEMYLAD